MKYEPPAMDSSGGLLCVGCGNQNLHHDIVTVSDYKLQVLVHYSDDEPQLVINTDDRLFSPSSDRNGVAISFWCEHCDIITWFTLEQHEGTTYLKSYEAPHPLNEPTRHHKEKVAKKIALNAMDIVRR